jgi:hypothetical protein
MNDYMKIKFVDENFKENHLIVYSQLTVFLS